MLHTFSGNVGRLSGSDALAIDDVVNHTNYRKRIIVS